VPWNSQLFLVAVKLGPALAAGNTVVLKASEHASAAMLEFGELIEAAGFPPGVVNIVSGFGEPCGRVLTSHPLVARISFTGGPGAARAVLTNSRENFAEVSLELGGKSPFIVFDDADLERALDAAVLMIYSLNGERCTSSSRLLVQDTIAETFTAKLAARANAIRVGHPLDPKTEVGPLIDRVHLEKVCSYFDKAQAEGATIAAGGTRVEGPGYFVRPTLFTGARNDMAIAQEEIFGPVLTAIAFRTEAEALAIANDVAYGLTGYIWTNDITRALRLSNALDAGMIWVNSENVRHLPTPFGGMKSSGIGRDGGDWSFEFYMEQKMIGLAIGQHAIPRLGA
jgi:5-carboxymethyl-2-hydroxymuconic-semialdehyde dehydrogenase